MTQAQSNVYRCVACHERVSLTPDRRCERCGVSYQSPAAQAVINADRTLQQVGQQLEQLEARRDQWAEYRERSLAELRRTIPVGWGARDAADAVVPDAVVADAVAPAQAVSRADAAATSAAFAAPASAAASAPQAPREPRRSTQVARKAMTAPALLGVAGASLLIAASIVFVALAWTQYSPLTRGLIVSAVAVAVAGIAVWLRRMDLYISSGAVGVVAMGFAGTATLAFSRDSGLLGAYDTPTALLVVCVAGLVLSRLGIQWVGSTAGLAFAGAAVGYTIAATSAVGSSGGSAGSGGGIRGIWVWILVGTLSAVALAWTHRFWKFAVARVATQWVAVVWLAVVGVGAAGWIWLHDGVFADALVALVPAVALGAFAWRWPRLAAGPAAFLVTLVAPAAASTWGASAWQQATAIAVAVAALLAIGPWAPEPVRLPLFIGLAPGYLTVAVASACYSIAITIARIIAGTYLPDTQMWAGVAALVAGMSVALLRTWRIDSRWTGGASIVGALMVVTGLGIVAFGVAEGFNVNYHSSVALTMTIGAVVLLVSVLAWTDARARWVSTTGAVAFAVVAGGHAAGAVGAGELPLWLALLLGAAPITVLVWRGRRATWWGITPAVTLLGAYGLAVGFRYEAGFGWQVLAAVVVTAVLLWAALWLPRSWQGVGSWHGPMAVGAIPALTLGLTSVVLAAQSVLAYLASQRVTGVALAWVLASLATAVALAAAVRLEIPEQTRRVAGVGGSVAVLAAASSAVYTTAHAVAPGQTWVLPVLGVAAAVISTLFVGLWRSRAASYTNGIGAVVILTIAGLHAAFLIPGETMWWPLVVAAGLAVLLCLVAARRWPHFTMGSAALVLTALAAGLAFRWSGIAAAVALAVVAATGLLWAVSSPRVRAAISPAAASRVISPTVWGATPALGLGVLVTVTMVFASLLTAITGRPLALPEMTWWYSLIAVGLAKGLWALMRGLRENPQPGGLQVLLTRGAALLWVAAGVVSSTTVGFLVGSHGENLDQNRHGWAFGATAAALVAGAVVLGATHAHRLRAYSDAAARRLARVGIIVWFTVLALGIVAAAASSERLVWVPLITIGVLVAALVTMASRWPVEAAGSVVVVSTVSTFLLLVDRVGFVPAVAASTALAALTLWVVRGAREQGRLAVWWAAFVGLTPAAVLALCVALQSAIGVAAVLGARPGGPTTAPFTSPWHAAVVFLVAAGVLSWRSWRTQWGSVVLGAAVVAAGGVSFLVAAPILAALALAAVVWRERVRTHAAVIAAAVGASMLLSLLWPALLATTALAGTVTLLLLARHGDGQKQHAAVWVAPATAAIAGSAGMAALHLPNLGAAVAMALATAVALWCAWLGLDARQMALPGVLGVASVFIPLVGLFDTRDGALRAGLALLVAGVAWLGALQLGARGGRWWCASVLSVGTALLMVQAEVSVIEAYTAVPAAAAMVLGLQWMRADAAVRSLTALWPGLMLALLPSYFALMVNPDSMLRTVLLTLAILGLAAWGVTSRWFAPILATAVTAVVISALQMIVGTHLVWRLVSFLVVGSLLLAVASWFEKIKTLR